LIQSLNEIILSPNVDEGMIVWCLDTKFSEQGMPYIYSYKNTLSLKALEDKEVSYWDKGNPLYKMDESIIPEFRSEKIQASSLLINSDKHVTQNKSLNLSFEQTEILISKRSLVIEGFGLELFVSKEDALITLWRRLNKAKDNIEKEMMNTVAEIHGLDNYSGKLLEI
jgi:hypothetical protein